MAQSLRTDFADVETATRFKPVGQEIMLRHEDNKIYIQSGARADSMFFQVFDYEFIHGDPKTALVEDNAMVMTEETAAKFFGDENPMGKIVNYDNRRDYIIRGVIKEHQGNSHFQIDFFIAENQIEPRWINNNYYTYAKLRKGADLDAFKKVMSDKFLTYIAPDVEQFLKMTIEEFLAKGNAFEYDIQPIASIHLHSHRDWEIQQNGNVVYIYVFIAIALLVLLIAGINFMNLSTARSAKRAKEVGIRKVSGASRGMLISQFLMESVIQSVIALFLAFIMVELFLPGFNNVMETELALFNDHFWITLGFALTITILYGLFSGSYPAFFPFSFPTCYGFKRRYEQNERWNLFRKSLVVVQFTASISLIIGMVIIFQQISFMHNKNLGFSGNQVLMAPIQTDKLAENFDTYEEEFKKNPNVLSISRANFYPGSNSPNQTMFELEGSQEQLPLWNMEVDHDIFETLDLTLLEGRKFDKELDNDSIPSFILNETALEDF